jgi:hypothetical protein
MKPNYELSQPLTTNRFDPGGNELARALMQQLPELGIQGVRALKHRGSRDIILELEKFRAMNLEPKIEVEIQRCIKRLTKKPARVL